MRNLASTTALIAVLGAKRVQVVIDKLGEDCLITATDFPHGDAFRQDLLAEGLKNRGDLRDRTIEKILSDNPRRLWNIKG